MLMSFMPKEISNNGQRLIAANQKQGLAVHTWKQDYGKGSKMLKSFKPTSSASLKFPTAALAWA